MDMGIIIIRVTIRIISQAGNIDQWYRTYIIFMRLSVLSLELPICREEYEHVHKCVWG